MTQTRTNTGNARKPNPPAFIAYHVADQGRGRKFWTRLGGVWPHRNGEGYTLFVNVLPVDFDGRIVLMTPREDDQDQPAEADGDPEAAAGDDEIPF